MFAIFLAQTLPGECTLSPIAGDASWPRSGVVLGDFVFHAFEDGYPIDAADEAQAVVVAAELRDAFLRTSRVARRTTSLDCRPSPPLAVDLSRCPAGYCRPLDWDPEHCGFATNADWSASHWLEVTLDWTGRRDVLEFTLALHDPTGPGRSSAGLVRPEGRAGAPCGATNPYRGALGRADLVEAMDQLGRWWAKHREPE